MKKPWDRTILTVHFWTATEPSPGDGLETSTGRRYLILRLKFGRPRNARLGPLRALECLVLPKGEPIEGTVFRWLWSPRKRRKR
jgi:hypothetical protein